MTPKITPAVMVVSVDDLGTIQRERDRDRR